MASQRIHFFVVEAFLWIVGGLIVSSTHCKLVAKHLPPLTMARKKMFPDFFRCMIVVGTKPSLGTTVLHKDYV